MCPVETIQGFFIRERTAAHGHSLPFPYGEGQVIHMKKRLFLILSVGIMLFAGCGSEGGITTGTPAEKTGTVADGFPFRNRLSAHPQFFRHRFLGQPAFFPGVK